MQSNQPVIHINLFLMCLIYLSMYTIYKKYIEDVNCIHWDWHTQKDTDESQIDRLTAFIKIEIWEMIYI